MNDELSTPLHLDISSTLFSNTDCPWLEQAQELLAKHGAILGVQMHNTSDEVMFEKCIATGLPLSLHLPISGEYMFNFAASDASKTFQAIEKEYQLMQKYGVSQVVFHGFLMTDVNIYAFGHGKSYLECMNAARRPELLRSENSIFVRDFTGSVEYLMRRERVKNNLQILREKYPDCTWCIENDFPALNSGTLRSRDMVYLEHDLCFDTGHMWAASKMLDMDFYAELDAVLNSGWVKMVHLHGSSYTFDMPHDQWGDGHLPLREKSAIDLKRVIKMCRNAHTKHIVLECGTTALEDIEIFLRYYFKD